MMKTVSLFGELEFPEFFLRQLDLDRVSPFAERFDLHQWAGRVDVLDGGAKVPPPLGWR